jgi:hypothetical protein
MSYIKGVYMTNSYAVNKKWKDKNKEKVKCHSIVNWQIRNGNLKKKFCFVCGNSAEAHHEDYNKPLDIIWLCEKHHAERHKQIRIEKGIYKNKKQYIKKGYNNFNKSIPYKKNKLLNVAITLRNQKKSYSEISLILKISKSTAYKWLNKVHYN